MVLNAVAYTMMSIEFLTPTSRNQYVQTTKTEHLALEHLRKDEDYITVTTDKGIALVVMDKTEYIAICKALLQNNSV